MRDYIHQEIYDLGSRFDVALGLNVDDKILVRIDTNHKVFIYGIHYFENQSQPFSYGPLSSAMAQGHSDHPAMQFFTPLFFKFHSKVGTDSTIEEIINFVPEPFPNKDSRNVLKMNDY